MPIVEALGSPTRGRRAANVLGKIKDLFRNKSRARSVQREYYTKVINANTKSENIPPGQTIAPKIDAPATLKRLAPSPPPKELECCGEEEAEPEREIVQTLASTDRSAAKMNEIISTPFTVWVDLINTITGLGINSDTANSEPLQYFATRKPEFVVWHEDRATYLFNRELEAYKTAIAYVGAAAGHVVKPSNEDSEEKRFAWTELANFDFRLPAVTKNLKMLELQLKGYQDQQTVTANSEKARNLMGLLEIVGQIGEKAELLRGRIVGLTLGGYE
ncbi:hypothetical protein ABW19_dt0204930 [Dactylella cylindrospora]|nr:hypothetical protein ABW19_dt0204930 [Dactylella cylindrospora]